MKINELDNIKVAKALPPNDDFRMVMCESGLDIARYIEYPLLGFMWVNRNHEEVVGVESWFSHFGETEAIKPNEQ